VCSSTRGSRGNAKQKLVSENARMVEFATSARVFHFDSRFFDVFTRIVVFVVATCVDALIFINFDPILS
jgi:hypothetical protein